MAIRLDATDPALVQHTVQEVARGSLSPRYCPGILSRHRFARREQQGQITPAPVLQHPLGE